MPARPAPSIPLFDAVGVVRSPVAEGRDEGWGEVVSELHLREGLAPGLRGIEEFSHLVVVFWMHQSSFDPKTDLLRRPRGRGDMPEVGIFAQRAKHRPSPIGVSMVRLLDHRDNVVVVQGLDAIDGTPLLDLKPYVPSFDRVDHPVVPEWMARLMVGYFDAER
jgi:tRNA (adenine37-N6)-methyltransferase